MVEFTKEEREYIIKILTLRQEIYDESPVSNIGKIRTLNEMLTNFMALNYNINIILDLDDNLYDILRKIDNSKE